MSKGVFDFVGGGPFRITFQRFGDQVLRAESDCEREAKYNASEEDSESEFDDPACDFQVLKSHRDGKDNHQ